MKEASEMRGEREALLALFFASLKSAVTEERMEGALPEGALEALFSLAQGQELTHAVGYGLQRSGLLPTTSSVEKDFRKREMLALYSVERLLYETGRVKELFEQEKIPFLPLKGAVVRSFYPEAFLRCGRDVDILVKREDCDRAAALLTERLGYTAGADRTFYDHKFTSPGGVNLELHFALMDSDLFPKAEAFLNGIWERVTPIQGKQFQMEMGQEDFLLFHLLHMAKHFVLGGCGVRPFLDLFLLEQKMTLDKEAFSRLLEETGMIAFYDRCMLLTRVWFSGGAHTQDTLEMERYLFSGGLFGTEKTEATADAARGGGKKGTLLRSLVLCGLPCMAVVGKSRAY